MFGRSTVARRNVSFFVPTNRVSEFAKRQNQTNASVELLENNYNEIKNYYDTEFKTLRHKIDDQPAATYKNEKNTDFVSNALESISIPFVSKHDSKPALTKQQDFTGAQKVMASRVATFLDNSSIRSLYDIFKSRRDVVRNTTGKLQPSFISTAILRLINLNQTVSGRLWFLTANKTKTDYDVRNLFATMKSLYISTRRIFNAFNIDNLSLHDCENLAQFYYDKHHFQKAIELIAKVEEKSQSPNSTFHLTNTLWNIKLGILGKTHLPFWRIYGRTLFSVSKNMKYSDSYQYPHHSHNFQIMVQKYQDDKTRLHLPDSLPVINTFIRGLGAHGDIPSLNKLIEMHWGIRVDKDSAKGPYMMEHFSIKKHVPSLLWPDEETLISIMLAYAKNGKLATAIQINNILLDKYQNNTSLTPINTKLYWELTLRTVGHFCDAVDRQLVSELGDTTSYENTARSLPELKYGLFDTISEMSTAYIEAPSRNMVDIKMKYTSVDILVEELPLIFKTLTSTKYNTSEINIQANEVALQKYVTKCCNELAKKGLFRDANKVVDNFSPSKEVTAELKQLLMVLQEQHARERARDEERKRKNIDDDDDDFGLW